MSQQTEGSRPRRARSPRAKEARREAILRAARETYDAEPSFAAFTMSALAKRAGLAKGTLYLYFPTKEALFLALLEWRLDAWFDELDARLEEGSGEWKLGRTTETLIGSIRSRTTLLRLLVILGAVVEHNVSAEDAAAFKRGVRDRALETGARLERRLPWLRAGEGARLLVHLHALVTGLWQLAEPAPVIRAALADAALAPVAVDFERDLELHLRALLRGMRDGRRGLV